jgi:pyruvate formate lyase activating enzyme
VGRPRSCQVCGRCVAVCPTGARQIAGEEKTVDEIVTQALRDRPYYGERGGVTLSGGEPLAQWHAARAVADRLRAEGVHVAMDTSCLAARAIIAEVPEHIDLVLADLKLVTPNSHRRWTGVDNARILAALRAWSVAMPARLWISVPVIPGVQDKAEFGRVAEFCSTLAHDPPIRLIAYHRLGDSKYQALGWPVPAFPGVVEEQMEVATRALGQRGIRILVQG